MKNILNEFEKRYEGDPSQTMDICRSIAFDYGLDPEEVADYVYIHRYEDGEEDDEDNLDE